MRFYADLHLHSKFARATSNDSDLEHMALWAAKKGVTVLGTGDFTHPAWFAEVKEKLVPSEPGLFRLRSDLEQWVSQQFPAFAQQPTRFLLEVEISTIYKKGDKTRKVHHLHYVPDLTSAERFIGRLSRIGNLNADGRPILGLDSRDLLEITLEAGEGAYLIPAHIWTPWFAVLGSKSGFDSVEECYGDLTPHIFALETGLSSDPPMNWRLSQLDAYRLVSNSDAHSPPKIGREACAFDCELSYWAIKQALETPQSRDYCGTVEFFPEEGKYHLDGHRACGVRLEPEETKRRDGLCPTCGKELTVGVMHRVDELADRANGARPQTPTPFRSFIPLPEVLGEIHCVGASSRRVADAYENLVSKLGPELFILEQAPLDELHKAGSTLLAEGIARMREGRVIREAGYDGEYGVIRVFTDDELMQGNSVSLLFDVPAMRKDEGCQVTPYYESQGRACSPLRADSVEAGASERERLARSDTPHIVPFQDGSERFESGNSRAEGEVEGERKSVVPSKADFTFAERYAPSLAFACDPLAGLDPDQRAAAEVTKGPLLILAGPGTGKTRTLTHRIAHLITNKGIPPEEILAVTFTNRAANEMKERLVKLIPQAADVVLVTTFHGLGLRLLREHGAKPGLPADFRVATEVECCALLVEQLKFTVRKTEQCLKRISSFKRVRLAGEPSATEDGAVRTPRLNEEDRIVVATYERAMRQRGWLDFDDLISLTVQLLEGNADVLAATRRRFHWVSVDEFQDLDALQYRFIQLLVPPDGNLCVIGDPDQAIYSFRGAEPRFFYRFVEDYSTVRTFQLRHNYRSGRAIVQGALQAIAPSSLVEGRTLEALSADATRITIHESLTD